MCARPFCERCSSAQSLAKDLCHRDLIQSKWGTRNKEIEALATGRACKECKEIAASNDIATLIGQLDSVRHTVLSRETVLSRTSWYRVILSWWLTVPENRPTRQPTIQRLRICSLDNLLHTSSNTGIAVSSLLAAALSSWSRRVFLLSCSCCCAPDTPCRPLACAERMEKLKLYER